MMCGARVSTKKRRGKKLQRATKSYMIQQKMLHWRSRGIPRLSGRHRPASIKKSAYRCSTQKENHQENAMIYDVMHVEKWHVHTRAQYCGIDYAMCLVLCHHNNLGPLVPSPHPLFLNSTFLFFRLPCFCLEWLRIVCKVPSHVNEKSRIELLRMLMPDLRLKSDSLPYKRDTP